MLIRQCNHAPRAIKTQVKRFEQCFRIEGKEGISPLIARHRSQTTPHNGQRLLGCTPSELKLIRLEATGDMLVEFVPKFFLPLHAPKARNRQHGLGLIHEKLHHLSQGVHLLIGFQVFQTIKANHQGLTIACQQEPK